jgi:ribosomal protein S18 acetylase RimI-like enzyme
MNIALLHHRSDELLALVREGMRRYTESQVAWTEYEDLTFVARDDIGNIIGALLGETGRGWLHISVAWVAETSRRQGIGSELVARAEEEARQRGCHGAYLDTFSYQAKPFYERLGYSVFGMLEDYPVGHQRYYMTKKLAS